MPNITEIISLLDELRSLATQGEWRAEGGGSDGSDIKAGERYVSFSDSDRGGLSMTNEDAKYIVALHNNLPALRQAALDGERYRKAGTELAEAIKKIQNRYTSTIGSSVSQKYIDIEDVLRAYRQAVEQKEV